MDILDMTFDPAATRQVFPDLPETDIGSVLRRVTESRTIAALDHSNRLRPRRARNSRDRDYLLIIFPFVSALFQDGEIALASSMEWRFRIATVFVAWHCGVMAALRLVAPAAGAVANTGTCGPYVVRAGFGRSSFR
jgi:hypothetical protein